MDSIFPMETRLMETWAAAAREATSSTLGDDLPVGSQISNNARFPARSASLTG
jgi:hypothetical protein